jgi:hypothetical protein
MNLSLLVVMPAVVLFLGNCATTVRSHSGNDTEAAVAEISRYCKDDPVVGFGTISASSAGEKVTGSIDVLYSGRDSFNVVLYSPFGASVGSLVSREDSIVVDLGQQHQIVALTDTFTSGLLPWGGALHCNEVVRAVTGQIFYCDSLTKLTPEKIITTGFRTIYIWKVGGGTFKAAFSRWHGRLRYVEITTVHGNSGVYTMRFESFSSLRARFITIEADDRNYFSIEFERLRQN